MDSLKDIVLENSRINYSKPIVFLCGGEVDALNPETLSVREALVEYLHAIRCELADGLTLAENYKDWLHDSVYKNLLEFETDIAHISSLVVVCLESPGAITEFGLFVKDPSLQRKMLVFVSEDHYRENSFIKLGPLRYLQSQSEESVCAYPWDMRDLKSSLSDSYEEMRGDILSALARQANSVKIDCENYGHVAFVIFEIVKTFRALKVAEISQYLGEIGINIKPDQLKRLLFLLEKLGLLASRKRGHTLFYYAKSDQEKVSFGGRFDQVSVGLEAQKYYVTNESEKPRLQIIQANLPPKQQLRRDEAI